MDEIDIIIECRYDLKKIAEKINSIRQYKIEVKKILNMEMDMRENYLSIPILMYFACERNVRRKEDIVQATYDFLEEETTKYLQNLYKNL